MSDSLSFTHERILLNNLLHPPFLERLMNTSMVHQSFRQNNSLAHRYLSKYIAEKNKHAQGCRVGPYLEAKLPLKNSARAS